MKLFIVKSRQDFLRIQNSFDKKIHQQNTLLLVRRNDEKQIEFLRYFLKTKDSFCRFAPVITKKKCKLAVGRNKIKRIVRDIVRKLFKTDNELFKEYTDYEIIVKNNIIENNIKYIDLYNEIRESFISSTV